MKRHRRFEGKAISFVLTLALVMVFGAVVAFAPGANSTAYATDAIYPVWVGKTQVTSENMEDVLGDADEGATVSFTPATTGENPTPATLKLNGATISEDGVREGCTSNIYSTEINLIIELEGTNKIDSKPAADKSADYAIRVDGGDLTLDGGGSLDVNAYDSAILLPDGGDCVINNGQIKATSESEDAIHATGLITINGGLVNATSDGQYAIYGYDGVIINAGTVIATGKIGICNSTGYIEIKDGSNVEAYGETMAIDGGDEDYPCVKNEIAGTGWTDTEGTTGKTKIEISTEGQSLNKYKKVRFPKEENVTVTLNFGEGHKELFEGKLGALREATDALMAYMSPVDPTIDITFKDPDYTEDELRAVISRFVYGLRGEEDWLIDNGELFEDVGYKTIDEYKTMLEVLEDIKRGNEKHNVPIEDGMKYYVLWGTALTDEIKLDNGKPVGGKNANTAKPTLPEGFTYDDLSGYSDDSDDSDDSGDPPDTLTPVGPVDPTEYPGYHWEDMDGDDVETFEAGKEYTCTVNIQIDPEGKLWRKYFDEDEVKASVIGGEIVDMVIGGETKKFDADTPGLLIFKFKTTAAKKANTMKVKGKTVKVKYSKLKKKAQNLKATKIIKFTNKGQGSKTYTLKSAKKGKKSFKKYFKINKKTGKLTIKKKLKKGKYTLKVKVRANGTVDYNPSAWKTVTIKVKVK